MRIDSTDGANIEPENDAEAATKSGGDSEAATESVNNETSNTDATSGDDVATATTPGSEEEVEAFQEGLHGQIVEQIKTIYDPEIPVDIYELGLIYEVEIDETGNTVVSMTLTSPACPVAGSLPGEVEDKVRATDGVKSAKVELVWDPPWTPEMMSESAKLELGMM